MPRKVSPVSNAFIIDLKLGEKQGKFQTVSLLVRSRFGEQPSLEAALEKMAVLTSEQLDMIATEIFQWQTLADVIAWLERLES
jgi:hypothetical protein